MELVKMFYENMRYNDKNATSAEMEILGIFLSSEVGCRHVATYKRWALDDKSAPDSHYLYTYSSNVTFLEEEDNNICLGYFFEFEEENPHRLKMTRQQFVQLLDDWQEKVCNHRPKEAIIKYENGQYSIETSN